MMQNFQPMKQERSYVFSFQPYGLHQAIPSFPTRRSSDLIGAVAQQHRSGPVPGRGLGDVQRQLRLAERGQQLLLGEGARDQVLDAPRGGSAQREVDPLATEGARRPSRVDDEPGELPTAAD